MSENSTFKPPTFGGGYFSQNLTQWWHPYPILNPSYLQPNLCLVYKWEGTINLICLSRKYDSNNDISNQTNRVTTSSNTSVVDGIDVHGSTRHWLNH